MKRLVSVLLVLLFVVTALTGCANPKGDPETESGQEIKHTDLTGFTLANAVYPSMAQYPNENEPDFGEKYDAWWKSKCERLSGVEGYRNALNPYFTASVRALLSGAGDENRVCSPVNVYMALSMLAEVTGGNSRAQLLTLLGADSIEALRAQASAVWNASFCDDGAVTSILANSLWLNENLRYRQDTLDTLAGQYYASSFRGDVTSPAFSRALQGWLDEQTGGLLTEQASRAAFDPRTVLALASAIYYRAKWSDTFTESATGDGVFHAAHGDRTCSFMHQTVIDSFYESAQYTAVAKGLAGSGRMYFILPDAGVSIDALLADDSTYALFLPGSEGVGSRTAQIALSVPRFDVVSDIDLTVGLRALGITDVFDTAASDFTPLTGDTGEIAVSQAEHAARVKIDEEGITAATYTVMMMAGSAMPTETVAFVLDRPFLFVVTGADGLPLFAGIVNNPVSAAARS